jgi:hypothetical protein
MSARRFCCFLLSVMCFVFLLHDQAMSGSSKVLSIGAGPLKQEEIAAKLDVLTADPQLGGATDRLMKRGEISIGYPEIFGVSGIEKGLKAVPDSSGDSKHDYYVVEVPFTIHPPYEATQYQKVVFRIRLSDQRFRAHDLLPKRETVSEKVKAQYALSPELKFREIEASLGSAGLQVEFDRLYPLIIAYGIGESEFYWEYIGEAGSGVRLLPGATAVVVSLQVPKGTKRVTGTMSYAAEMRYEWLGGWREQPAKTRDYAFAWELPLDSTQ